MKTELKLSERNIQNTNPKELKKLHNENFDRLIENIENIKKFSIINFIFFTFVWCIFYINKEIFSDNIIIIPSIIAFVFSLITIFCQLKIKLKLIQKRISNALLDF